MPGAGIDELPGVLAEIAEIAGKAAAANVAQTKGGARAYIPRPERLTPDHWLVIACGDKAADVAERLGGGEHLIPLGPWAGNRAAVKAAIAREAAAGRSAPEIARAVGVTDRTVRNHKAGKAASPSDQLSLF